MIADEFVIALLTQAAEHRAKAADCRSHVRGGGLPPWLAFPSLDYLWERDALEQEGLASVYEGFAERVWLRQGRGD